MCLGRVPPGRGLTRPDGFSRIPASLNKGPDAVSARAGARRREGQGRPGGPDPMVCRYIMAGALAMALLPAVGCSKTQDTAPQTKIFGQPPVIKSATLNVTQTTVLCDFTAAMDVALAQEGMQLEPGPWVAGGTNTQLLFQPPATAPDPTSRNNDLNLVH